MLHDLRVLAERPVEDRQRIAEFRERIETLSDREREVFLLAIEGLTHKQIGARLGMSERTVEVHRYRIYKIADVPNAVALARLATKAGF